MPPSPPVPESIPGESEDLETFRIRSRQHKAAYQTEAISIGMLESIPTQEDE